MSERWKRFKRGVDHVLVWAAALGIVGALALAVVIIAALPYIVAAVASGVLLKGCGVL